MSEKEYIVSLHKNVDYDQFKQDMIASTGSGPIPGRSVDIANARPGSLRNTHYSLTDAEAEALRADSRVAGVELRPQDRDDIKIGFQAVQNSDFTKTTSANGDFVNWGLLRSNLQADPYVGNIASGGYNYTLTGRNIDIVIQDSGIQFGHPEFADEQGNDRLQRINWYSTSGITGTQPGGFYADYDGHGTHVASTALGRTFGWAKDANLYVQKLAGLEGPSDPNPGLPIQDAFDVIKGWHNNKPVNPLTGVKNPTVVNMSWGYFAYYSQITGGNYRGTPWTGTTRETQYGMLGSFRNGFYTHPTRLVSVDTDIQELIDAGIHVVIASGNDFHKIDVPGGNDYDNYYTSSLFGNVFYHRGSSPYDDEAFIVGNVDSTVRGDGSEQKAQSSNHGPGTHLYAPGTNIVAALSNNNLYTDGDYPLNSFYRQGSLSGTSMAAPQVTGALALYLELNPIATPAIAKANILNNSVDDVLYDTLNDDDYADLRSLNGGENEFLFNKFNGENPTTVEFPFAPRYSLSTNKQIVTEDDTFTITLTLQNVADGVDIPYTITGVSSADINNEPLTGVFTSLAGTAQKSFTTVEDFLTEGNEVFTMVLDNGRSAISVEISDTSTLADVPTYTLAGVNSVNEGESFIVTLTTTNVNDGTVLPFTITGVTSQDLGGASLTGNFVVNNNTAQKSFTASADLTTDGDKTFSISLDNGQSNIKNILVVDTSITPVYTLSVDSITAGLGNSVEEGATIFVTLDVTELEDGTLIPFTITGIDANDLSGESLTDNFNITAGTATKSFTFSFDTTTEGDETFTLSLDNGAASISVDIADISPALPAGTEFDISVVNIGSAFWRMTGTDAIGAFTDSDNRTLELDYGDSIRFDISSPDYPFYLKTAPTTGTNDLIDGIINNGTDNGVITFLPDRLSTFYYAHPDFADMQGQINVVLNRARYTLSVDNDPVTEGDTFTITLDTTNVPNGTSVPYTITGVSLEDIEIGSLTGVFVVENNTASLSFETTEDFFTEGDEVFNLALDNGLADINIVITDTSIAGGTSYAVGATNNGTSSWTMAGTDANGNFSGDNPTINIDFGDTLVFNISATGHPLWIKTVNSTGDQDGVYYVDPNGVESGSIIFTPRATGTYYYNCQYHSGMNGTIIVS